MFDGVDMALPAALPTNVTKARRNHYIVDAFYQFLGLVGAELSTLGANSD